MSDEQQETNKSRMRAAWTELVSVLSEPVWDEGHGLRIHERFGAVQAIAGEIVQKHTDVRATLTRVFDEAREAVVVEPDRLPELLEQARQHVEAEAALRRDLILLVHPLGPE